MTRSASLAGRRRPLPVTPANVRRPHHNSRPLGLAVGSGQNAPTRSFLPGAPEAGKGYGVTGHEEVLLIPVDRVEPLYDCKRSHGVFNDNGVETAQERVLSLLNGFRRGDRIPPLQVVRLPEGFECSHRLYHGAHRFYCSVAAGYSHVPAIEVAGSH